MSASEIGVFSTIAAAVICWALSEATDSRALWTAGAVLATMHSLAAFVVFYGGSHETARLETMRQTAALTGTDFSGGIYINYAFLAVWLGDATWWWAHARSYRLRPRAMTFVIRGFIFFIIVNGAVIFADGLARVVGVVAVAIVVASWLGRRAKTAH